MQALKDGGGDPLTSGINFIYDDSGSRIIKAKGGDVTAYINQFFTVRQPHNSAGAAMSKHVFIGNTRILSQVEHGTSSFTSPTSGLGGSGSTSGSGSGSGSGTGFVTVITSATVYQGASQSSPPEGTANVGDVLELLPSGNSSVHNGAMVKVMFQGLIGFIPSNDVTASTTTSKSGGKGGNKGGGGSTGGTSTSVLPQVTDDHFVFYYHTDHLGSTGLVTDREGKLSENVQYFPFGETWVEQHRGMSPFPDYLFSGKTLDVETGLYYFGARYYDPRTSVWQSTDTALEKYLPRSGGERNENELGVNGGVFLSSNLGLYTYSNNNPINYSDPDGRWASKLGYTVHQDAIKKVLSKYYTPAEIRILQDRQSLMDDHSKPEEEYMHSMMDSTAKDASGRPITRSEFIKQSEKFLHDQLKAAIEAKDPKAALEALGDALHTAQDATSPVHHGFQDYGKQSHFGHMFAERDYPAKGTLERSGLEGATLWISDIYKSGDIKKIPSQFYTSEGELNIPKKYLNPSTQDNK